MKHKRLLCLVLSFALLLGAAMPGIMAFAANNSIVTEDGLELFCDCGALDGEQHASSCPLYGQDNVDADPFSPECTCGAEEGAEHESYCPCYVECTCGTVDGVHDPDCPRYEQEELECSCGAAEGEPHLIGCPLYEEAKDEDEPVVLPEYVYPPYVSVGPFIEYEPLYRTFSLRAVALLDDDALTVPEGETRDDGSILYEDSVIVDKTIADTGRKDDADNPIYSLNLTASAKSVIVNATTGVDIILMLDMSTYMNEVSGRVDALKTAVTNFINTVAERSPASRIAIVTYSNTSNVKSGTKSATDGALVTLNSEGKTALLNIVNDLSADSGYSNCDLAMADALKIFQDANQNSDTDALGTVYKDRTRVAILFTAGLPGQGKDSSSTEGWKTDAKNRAQACMSLSVIMKGERFATVTPPDDSAVASGSTWGQLKSQYNPSYEGCGATVYTVGLNLPNAYDQTSIIGTEDQLEAYAQYSNGSFELRTTSRQAALVNEYLYRVSSHRPTSEHFFYDQAEDSFKDAFVRLPIISGSVQSGWQTYSYTFNVKNLFSNTANGNHLWYFYPDQLTRNLDNGYFLTADDKNLDRLTDIFTQIAIQTGSAVEDLTIKDYIDPAFVLVDAYGTPLTEGALIGTSGDGHYQGIVCKDANGWYVEWEEVELAPESADGTTEAKTFNETIYVKRADYSFGGYSVPTNLSPLSGVYPSQDKVYPFPQPTVDLPIDYEIDSQDQNIYRTNSADLSALLVFKQLVSNSRSISYKPDGANNAYVDIEYTMMDSDGTTVGTLYIGAGDSIENCTWQWTEGGYPVLANDVTYTISCTVTPADDLCDEVGTDSHHIHAIISGITPDNANATVNVYKPELTFADSEVYYGDSAPTGYSDNCTGTAWKHGTSSSTDSGVKMAGTEPTLTLEYTPDATKIADNKINTKQDIDVAVAVKVGSNYITSETTFIHTECVDSDTTCTVSGGVAFLLHVKTCELTISKTGGATGEPYVFVVKKDGVTYSEVTIVGNDSVTIHELPVGTYTIEEDTGWSWRYTASYSDWVSLSKSSSKGTITCTNEQNMSYWLNGYSSVVTNVYNQQSATN